MIRVTFLYPNKPSSHFNADYYIDIHMPLAIRLLGPALKELGEAQAEIEAMGASLPYGTKSPWD